MRTLQDYRDIYREIADNLGLQGDSVEMLVQMLAQASFISEVENVSYAQEASLEKATLMNSKIQHSMDEMYSVFRGSCPRVILRFRPTKYFSFNVFDKIISSNSFDIYYIGYLSDNGEKSEDYSSRVAIEEGFIYGPTTISPALSSTSPDEVYTIIGILAKSVVSESWTTVNYNTFYVDCTSENLSNDMWVKIGGLYYPSTRLFSEHILDSKVFDLTLPSFGSRLYVADIFRSGKLNRDTIETESNINIEASYFVYSQISDYNNSELKKINLKGAEMVSFTEPSSIEEIAPGVKLIPERPRDNSGTVHYRANRDRYVNSILRSNSDIGTVLEEMYPDKILPGGTTYRFNSDNSILDISYIPSQPSNLLTTSEISDFLDTKKAYYITDTINITKGIQYTAVFNIVLELYQNGDVNEEVSEILENYGYKFNMYFDESKEEEIRALISKISNIKQIKSFDVQYIREDGTQATEEELLGEEAWNTYFKINYIIDSTIQSKVI